MKRAGIKLILGAIALLCVLMGASAIHTSAQPVGTLQASSVNLQPTGAQASSASSRPSGNGAWPVCARPGATVPLPADFPSTFPFPPGTVITDSEQRSGGWVVSAMSPWDAHTAAVFLTHDLPSAGFKMGKGDSEPNEAEAAYAGAGYMGRWKVRAVPGCPAAVTLIVFAQK